MAFTLIDGDRFYQQAPPLAMSLGFTVPPLAAGDLLIVVASWTAATDTAPTVTFAGGAWDELLGPPLSIGGHRVQVYSFRATAETEAGAVVAAYSEGLGSRSVWGGYASGTASSPIDSASLTTIASADGITYTLGPAAPADFTSGLALAILAAEIWPDSAPPTWSDGFTQQARVGVDGDGNNLESTTMTFADKEFTDASPITTTATSETSVPRDGVLLFIGYASEAPPETHPASRTVYAGPVSDTRYRGGISRTVFGGGYVSRIIYQLLGGRSMFLNATDYTTIQAAIDAAEPVNGTVFIPRGTYTSATIPAFTGINVPDGVTVVGEGRGSTVLSLAGGATTTHLAQMSGSSSAIMDLTLEGPDSSGSGVGILINPDQLNPLYYPRVERVQVRKTASWGIQVRGVTVMPLFNDLLVWDAKSGGSFYGERHASLGGSTTFRFMNCLFAGPSFSTYGTGPQDRGLVHLDGVAGVSFEGCTFEPPTDSTLLSFATTASGGVCHNVDLRDCYFECGAATRAKAFITLSGGLSHLVLDNLYVRSTATNEVLFFKCAAAVDVLRGLSLRNVSIYTSAATPAITDFVFGAGMTVTRQEDALCYAVNASSGVARSLTYTGP